MKSPTPAADCSVGTKPTMICTACMVQVQDTGEELHKMMNKDIRQSLVTKMEQSEFDALLLFGLPTIQYTAGVVLPFAHARRNQFMALLWPLSAEPVLFI